MDIDLFRESQVDLDTEGVEQAAIVVEQDPQVERVIGVNPCGSTQAEREPFEIQADEDPGSRQEDVTTCSKSN